MAQRGRGGQSDWQRQLAAQRREAEAARREAERQARDQARLAKAQEKAAKERYTAERQGAAEAQSALVGAKIAALDEVLADALARSPFSFDRLEVVAATPSFHPGRLSIPAVAPNWADYAPEEPRGFARMFGGAGRYQRQAAAARAEWEAATAEFERSEADRLTALAAARAERDRKVAQAQAAAATKNAHLAARRTSFAAGEPEAVEWFVGQVLNASRYPEGFPRQYQVAYRPENRDVVVEFELPPQQVVPDVREYRYVKTATPSTRSRDRAATSSNGTRSWSPASHSERCTKSSPRPQPR
jgi:restriction system protein